MNKQALDQAAKDYWKLLYGEYGEALVRDIPRRIKAALLANKKVASIDEAADIRPVAKARFEDGMFIEGLYESGAQKLLFRATLDQGGNVSDIQSIELR